MIETTKLALLNKFMFLPLSSRIKENKTLFPGKYYIFREHKQYGLEEEYIELLPDGKIGHTNLDVRGFPWGWEVRIHQGENMVNQNSFDVKGLSTMEIIYADEKIIYALGYANVKYFFIKEEYVDNFTDNDDILLYFSKIENKWAIEQLKLLGVTYPVDIYLDYREPLGFWIPFIISIIITAGLAQLNNWFWLSILIVFPVILFLFKSFLKYRRKKLIKRYKDNNPDDILVHYPTINAFDF